MTSLSREHAGSGTGPARGARGSSAALNAVALAAWLGIVVFTTTRHEYWRDEVRVLSIVEDAQSPLDLVRNIRYEGHPALWYLLLYFCHWVADTRLVLPIASLAVAAVAMGVFMLRAPFPWWFKALFLFCAFPLHEYSVKARNYGISMLLLFAGAALYRHRSTRWLALAIALALLANTNIHATALAILFFLAWVAEERSEAGKEDRTPATRLTAAAGIVGAGILLSYAIVNPPPDTVLTRFSSKTPSDLASALLGAVFHPRLGFRTLFPSFVPWPLGHAILLLAILGLLRRPVLSLSAFAGLVGLNVLFRVGSPGDYRHAGVFLCFLIALYWIMASAPDRGVPQPRWVRRLESVGYAALTALVVASVYRSRIVPIDLLHPMSSSKALGELLNSERALRDAILVPEPDYYLESLPYYAANRIYLARERRFGKYAAWSSANAQQLSLGELLMQARKLKSRYQRPVLIVLGHPTFMLEPAGEAKLFYRKRFTWSVAERTAFDRSVEPVAEFWDAYSDENYTVYAVK